MKIRVLSVTVAIVLCAFTFSMPSEAQGNSIAKTWQGTLNVQGTELRILFDIAEDETGFTATMSSPDQGAMDLPVTSVSLDENRVILEMKQMRATYDGVLNEDGTAITGTWTQGPAKLPLNLAPIDQAPTLSRPQEPKPPFPYTTEDVAYNNPTAEGITLAGTLTLPEGEGPHPVLLFITGSGPQDRDEQLLGHKPFLVIADHLTRLGFATLRVDDRGVGDSTGDFAAATMYDFITDVHAGLAYLKTRSEIDDSRIGLLGHSEGGLIAPVVSKESQDVAFLVLLAGPAVPGAEIIALQSELIQRAQGLPESMIQQSRETNKSIYALIVQESDSEKMEAGVRAIIDALPAFQKQLVDADSVVDQVSSPWFKAFLEYDPRPKLEEVTCPVLVLFGEKDLQVPPSQSVPEMTRTLRPDERSNVQILVLPNLNHLFQECETGSPTEYGVIEETISPVALKAIGDWLRSEIPE